MTKQDLNLITNRKTIQKGHTWSPILVNTNEKLQNNPNQSTIQDSQNDQEQQFTPEDFIFTFQQQTIDSQDSQQSIDNENREFFQKLNSALQQSSFKYYVYFIKREYAQSDEIKVKSLILNQNTRSEYQSRKKKIQQKNEEQIDVSKADKIIANVRTKKNERMFLAQNKQTVIQLLRQKLFQEYSSKLYYWDFDQPVSLVFLSQDFNTESMIVIRNGKNKILLASKAIILDAKENKDLAESQSIYSDQEINEEITPISQLKINRMLFDKAKKSQQQRYLQLMNIFQKYSNFVEVDEKAQYNKQMQIKLYLQFKKGQDMVRFAEETCKLQFQINREGQIISEFEYEKLQTQNQQVISFFFTEFKMFNQISIQNIKNANSYLQELGLWHFFTVWQNGFKQILQNLIQNWEVYNTQLLTIFIKFVRLLQYRIEKLKLFNLKYKKKINSCSQIKENSADSKSGIKYDNKINPDFDFYDIFFKELFNQAKQLANHLGIEKLQTFLNKSSSKKIHNKLTGQQGQSTLQSKEHYLQQFKRIQQINDEKDTQKIINHYIIHKISSGQDTPFNIKINSTKKTLSQYLNQTPGQQTKPKEKIINLRKIITCINSYFTLSQIINQSNNSCQLNKNNQQQNETQQSLLLTIEEQRLVQTKCLGCTTFFKNSANILDQTVNAVPLKAFPSVAQMKDYQSQIKDNICAMLNSGGGIILFDCRQDNEKIVVNGTNLSQKKKEQHEQRFTSYLDTFQPKNSLKKCIMITFVPVVSEKSKTQDGSFIIESYTGEDSVVKQKQSYRLRPYLRNIYVMRVRICPLDGQKVYFWNQNNDKQQKEINKSFLCTYFAGDAIKSVPLGRISKLIKQKVKKYYIPQRIEANKRNFLLKISNCFGHQCRIPQAGIGWQQNSHDQSLNSITGPTSKYQNMSLLIAKQRHLSQIKRRLIQQGIQCQIKQKFKDQNFQSAKHSAVIYHNKRFQELLRKILQNPKFIFNGRSLIVINITNYIKLSKRNQYSIYPEEDFKTLRIWLNKEFPDERLRLFEFRPNQRTKEYYLQTDSQQCTLYIYYLLNNYQEKAVFKNPLHLDKMSPEEKEKKIIELYSQENEEDSPTNITRLNPRQLRI